MTDMTSPLPPSQQVAAHVRALIDSGRLRPGERIPSSRDLAEELGVAKGTILAAYTSLRDVGILRAVWHGYVVSDMVAAGNASIIMREIVDTVERLESQGFRRDAIHGVLRRALREHHI